MKDRLDSETISTSETAKKNEVFCRRRRGGTYDFPHKGLSVSRTQVAALKWLLFHPNHRLMRHGRIVNQWSNHTRDKWPAFSHYTFEALDKRALIWEEGCGYTISPKGKQVIKAILRHAEAKDSG